MSSAARCFQTNVVFNTFVRFIIQQETLNVEHGFSRGWIVQKTVTLQ